MKGKTVTVLAVITVLVIIAAALFLRDQSGGIPGRGELLFPELRARINDVKEISIQSKGDAVTVTRQETYWAVQEKEGYRAAMDQVRKLLIGMAELTILEPKTRNPERYAKLDLQDVDAEDSTSTLVGLKDEAGKMMAHVLIGRRRPARGDSTKEEIYVRKPGDPQTWLTVGRFRIETAPDRWIDKQVLNIDSQRVRQVRVTHANGETVVIRKTRPADSDYTIVDMPAKSVVKSQFTVNNIADTIANLTLDDIRLQADVELPKRGAVTASLETFDGLRVRLKVIKKDDSHYAALSAEFDEALIEQPEEAPAPDDEKTAEGDGQATDADEGDKAKTDKPGDEPETATPVKLKSPAEVQEDVKSLNERTADWVYVIPSFRADAIAKRRADLFSEKS